MLIVLNLANIMVMQQKPAKIDWNAWEKEIAAQYPKDFERLKTTEAMRVCSDRGFGFEFVEDECIWCWHYGLIFLDRFEYEKDPRIQEAWDNGKPLKKEWQRSWQYLSDAMLNFILPHELNQENQLRLHKNGRWVIGNEGRIAFSTPLECWKFVESNSDYGYHIDEQISSAADNFEFSD